MKLTSYLSKLIGNFLEHIGFKDCLEVHNGPYLFSSTKIVQYFLRTKSLLEHLWKELIWTKT